MGLDRAAQAAQKIAELSGATPAAAAAALDNFDAKDVIGALAVAPGGNGGSQAVSQETVQISSAELLALDDTAKVLVAAAGGRTYHVLHGLVLHYRFGSAAYTGDFVPSFGYGTDLAALNPSTGPGAITSQERVFNPQSGSSLGDGFLLAEEDAYAITVNGSAYLSHQWLSWFATDIEDKPLAVANFPLVALADGDGTLTVRVFYTTIDGAP